MFRNSVLLILCVGNVFSSSDQFTQGGIEHALKPILANLLAAGDKFNIGDQEFDQWGADVYLSEIAFQSDGYDLQNMIIRKLENGDFSARIAIKKMEGTCKFKIKWPLIKSVDGPLKIRMDDAAHLIIKLGIETENGKTRFINRELQVDVVEPHLYVKDNYAIEKFFDMFKKFFRDKMNELLLSELNTRFRRLSEQVVDIETNAPGSIAKKSNDPVVQPAKLPVTKAPPRSISTTATKTVQESSFTFLYIFLIILVITIPGAIFLFVRRHKKVSGIQQRKRQVRFNTLVGEDRTELIEMQSVDQRVHEDLWQIAEENIQYDHNQVLGSGASSAVVYKGRLIGDSGIKRVHPNGESMSVYCNCTAAIKKLRSWANEASKIDLQNEIDFMKKLRYHPNLVCMLGYVSTSVAPILVLEYCENGDLKHYLRNYKNLLVERRKELRFKTLVRFAWQVNNGLKYLAGLKLIHRDVAARNMMLDRHLNCKIGDFGLCRLTSNEFYMLSKNREIPFCWSALETLRDEVYSLKSDVWAFGVLLYEIFSLGDDPYPSVDKQLLCLLEYLKNGKRMNRPKKCPDAIYELMCRCWEADPEDRPGFCEIGQILKEILEDNAMDFDYANAVEINAEETSGVQTERANEVKRRHDEWWGKHPRQKQQ